MEGYRALIVEALFPSRCVACGADGVWCCDECQSAIELVRVDPCAGCGSLVREHVCETDSRLDGLVVIGFYHDPRLREVIHGLKYQSATCLLPVVSELVLRYRDERIQPWPWAGESTLGLQAVVGSADRVRKRGFDQAELLRDVIIESCIPWGQPMSLLTRGNALRAQAELEASELRRANVLGAYSAIPGQPYPEAVVLVDDVFTTGSTMREAARVLRQTGVKRVYGFALALGA